MGGSSHRPTDDVTCPICYDALFGSRDALGDEHKLAAVECGHVFHETCILRWFGETSKKWFRDELERHGGSLPPGPDGRPITPLHASVECPTCRTRPSGPRRTMRLFFQSERDEGKASSQINATAHGLGKRRGGGGKEKEVRELARRARDLEAGIRDLRPTDIPGEGNMSIAVAKAGEIIDEWDDLSDETVRTVAPYFEQLRDAIHDIRHVHITNHDTIARHDEETAHMVDMFNQRTQQLQAEADALRTQNDRLKRQMEMKKLEIDMLRTAEVPRLVKVAVEKEKKEKKEMGAALQAAQNARLAEKTTWSAMERGYLAQVQLLQQQLNEEANERNEKIRLAKRCQEKADKYKRSNEKLKAEMETLKTKLAATEVESESSRSRGLAERSPSYHQARTTHDPPVFTLSSSDPIGPPSGDGLGDESLLVDIPSFDDSWSFSPDARPRSGPSRHPTARTFQFDLGNRHPSKSSKSKSDSRDPPGLAEGSKENEGIPRADAGKAVLADEKDVIIIPSSPDVFFPPAGPLGLKRTNPYSTVMREGDEKKKKLFPQPLHLGNLKKRT